MRKSIAVFALAALAAIATPVFAITGNWVDDNEHPFVGLVVFYDASGAFIWRCSGSLISPTKFVTAGHCADTAEGAASARVYFQQDAGAHFDPATLRDPITGYPDLCAPGTLGTLCATSSKLYNYGFANFAGFRSEEHTSELQSQSNLVCRLLLEKKKNKKPGGTAVPWTY